MSNMIWTDKPLVINEGEINIARAEAAVWQQGVYPIGNELTNATLYGGSNEQAACEVCATGKRGRSWRWWQGRGCPAGRLRDSGRKRPC